MIKLPNKTNVKSKIKNDKWERERDLRANLGT